MGDFVGSVVGNYRVERELSEGGMATVFVGRTVSRSEILPEGFPVVLKVMSEELANEQVARKRFLKEHERTRARREEATEREEDAKTG